MLVLTHQARDAIALTGTTFHFVTGGVEAAHELAVDAAGDWPISIVGGASCARQAIRASIVEEIDPQVNSAILGSGERLFDGLEEGSPRLELERVLEAPGVAHLRYRVVR